MARKFIVEEKFMIEKSENMYEITSNEVKHIQVLRYDIGDRIVINNKIYEIIKMTKSSILVKYIKDEVLKKKSLVKINLYLALLKNEMLDLSVKKATELGAENIFLFNSENVVVKLDEKGYIRKEEKLKKTIIEAVKQCGRDDIPCLRMLPKIDDIKQALLENDVNFFAYEKEENFLKDKVEYVKHNIKDISSIGIIVGPEGGFTPKEYEMIKKIDNTFSVSLGNRILRAETAVMNLLSIITYEFEKYK